ncbi:transposable element Tcb2 transposase [Trichonephila clavipes]|nr:transposable element Tcb2 transposase [Trichonephila clavipes]
MTVPVVKSVNRLCNQYSLYCMGFESRRPTRLPLLNARHRAAHLAWTRDHSDWSAEDWKRVTWREEFGFSLLNTDWKLRLWRQVHEARVPA